MNRIEAPTTSKRWLRGIAGASACPVLVAALLLAGRAQAAADCNVSVSGVAFGVYDPFATTPDDSTGTVTVTCSSVGNGGGVTRLNYSVALSAGASGSYSQRFMTSGAPRLNYNLYTDPARSLVWGNGGGSQLIAGSMTVGPGVGNRTRTVTHTVYGRLPALQDAAEGNHMDSIVVTLTF
jgi:spore coat protein U-like protein